MLIDYWDHATLLKDISWTKVKLLLNHISLPYIDLLKYLCDLYHLVKKHISCIIIKQAITAALIVI